MRSMRDIVISAPREEYLDYLAANARPEDVAEIYALTDSSVREAIGPLTAGRKYVALNAAGTPFAVFGLREVEEDATIMFVSNGRVGRRELKGTAFVWMIGTREVAAHSREMLAYGRMIIKDWLRRYSCLCNMVHAENRPAVRMLRKWGFSILPAAPFGPRRSLFHPFFITDTY